jgi:hypothetical protein
MTIWSYQRVVALNPQLILCISAQGLLSTTAAALEIQHEEDGGCLYNIYSGIAAAPLDVAITKPHPTISTHPRLAPALGLKK